MQIIARIGRWLRTALTLCYLKFFTPEGLLAAAGWDKDRRDSFFAERFCIEVPSELVAYVFPGLAELSKQVGGEPGCILLQSQLRWRVWAVAPLGKLMLPHLRSIQRLALNAVACLH